MPSNAVMIQRDAQIVEALNKGASPTELAATYKLSTSRVRAIRAKAGRMPQASQYAASSNGHGSSNGNGAAPTGRRSGSLPEEIGASGLKYTWGTIHEEFLTDLNSPDKRYRVYHEMRSNDAVIGAALLANELSIRRIDWRFDGDDNDPRRDFLQSALEDMSHSWADHLSEVLTFIPFGWSWFETVYKRRQGADGEGTPSNFRDGKIGWSKLAFRSQDSLMNWMFDERGNVQAMVQSTYPDFRLRTIPLSKSILYRTTREKNNPEGRSLLRAAYPSYYYAKNLRAIEAIGAERDLAGLPHLKLPADADTTNGSTDMSRAQSLVRNVRQDEQAGIITPAGWEFGLVSAPGSKQFSVGEIINRYETRMAMSFLAQFLMLGINGVGAYSLSKDMTDFFAMGVTTWADVIAETFSQHEVPRLLRLNGMPLEAAPRLTHGPLGTPDLEAIGGFISHLKGYIQPDTQLENWARGIAEMPELTEIEIKRREKEAEDRTAAAKAIAAAKTTAADEAKLDDKTTERAEDEVPVAEAA